MDKSILLINPPTTKEIWAGEDNYFPMGLLSIGTVLKENRIDVKIIDVNNDFYDKPLDKTLLQAYITEHILQYIMKNKPDVIGIGCTFSGVFTNLKIIAESIGDYFPQIPIVLGGSHPTIFPKEILSKFDFIDYIIIGEGEYTFLQLVKSLLDKNHNYELIDGIAYRNNGNVIMNQKTMFISDLDKLPLVNYGILDNINNYNMNTSNWYSPKGLEIGQPFPLVSSRSCPNRCTFCNMRLMHGDRFRPRTAKNVVDEIEKLYNTYGVRYFQFMDDNPTFDEQRMIDICKGILDKEMDIQFDTSAGMSVKKVDEELINTMIEAGMIRTTLAIESGSEYIRNECMKKYISTKKIHEVFNICRKHNHLFLKAIFVLGMPQENQETLGDTFDLIRDIPFDDVTFTFATPFPGTELFDYCLEHDLFLYDVDDIVNIADYQQGSHYPHIKPHDLTVEELVDFKKTCIKYLNKRRSKVDLPINYPLTYEKEIQNV